jgi:hypothetical protein
MTEWTTTEGGVYRYKDTQKQDGSIKRQYQTWKRDGDGQVSWVDYSNQNALPSNPSREDKYMFWRSYKGNLKPPETFETVITSNTVFNMARARYGEPTQVYKEGNRTIAKFSTKSAQADYAQQRQQADLFREAKQNQYQREVKQREHNLKQDTLSRNVFAIPSKNIVINEKGEKIGNITKSGKVDYNKPQQPTINKDYGLYMDLDDYIKLNQTTNKNNSLISKSVLTNIKNP